MYFNDNFLLSFWVHIPFFRHMSAYAQSIEPIFHPIQITFIRVEIDREMKNKSYLQYLNREQIEYHRNEKSHILAINKNILISYHILSNQ